MLSKTFRSLAVGLLNAWQCLASPFASPLDPRAALELPPACLTKPLKCFTHTVHEPAATCAVKTCRTPPGIMCPMVVSMTTMAVPCKAECCPMTPTVTVQTACPVCTPNACVIPTVTRTITTGCPAATPEDVRLPIDFTIPPFTTPPPRAPDTM